MINILPAKRAGSTPAVELGIVEQVRLLLNSVEPGDENVVFTAPFSSEVVVAALYANEARQLARAILDAADVIDPNGSPDRRYDEVFNDPSARGRFKEGMSIAQGIYRRGGR